MGKAFAAQLIGAVVTVVWAAVVGWIIIKIVQGTVGLRVSHEEEVEGLDIQTHGERAYDL